jgi:hypothetical protein
MNDSPNIWRWRTSRTLIVVAFVLVTLTVVGTWVRLVALESDVWSQTSTEVIEDPAVRSAVSHRVVDTIQDRVDIESRVEERTSDRADLLVAPLANIARQQAYEQINRALASQEFEDAWTQANVEAHQQVVAFIKGEESNLQESGGRIELDIRPLLTMAAERIGFGTRVVDRLPEQNAFIDIASADELDNVRGLIDTLQRTVQLVGFVALLMLLVAIWLGRDRIGSTVRWISLGAIVSGVSLVVIRAIGGEVIVRRVVEDPAYDNVAINVWHILTEQLLTVAVVIMVLGAIGLIAQWVFGRSDGRVANACASFVQSHHPIAVAIWAVPVAALIVFNPALVVDRWLLVLAVAVGAAVIVELLSDREIEERPARTKSGAL